MAWSTVTAFVPRAATTFSTGLNAKENGRREFFTQAASQVAATATLVISPSLTNAVDAPTKPKIYTTDNGVKYAVLKQSTVKISKDRNLSVTNPKPGDLVVIDYTGYLSNGQVSGQLLSPLSKLRYLNYIIIEESDHTNDDSIIVTITIGPKKSP